MKLLKYLLFAFVLFVLLAFIWRICFCPRHGSLLGGKYCFSYEQLDISTPEKVTKVLNKFTGNTGVSFPQSTYLLNAAVDHSRDPDVCLKIRVKLEDLDAFLKDTTIRKIDLYDSTSGRSYPGRLDHHELRWWQVSKVKNWKTGEIPLPNGASLVILIDYDHTDEYIIYLTWGFV